MDAPLTGDVFFKRKQLEAGEVAKIFQGKQLEDGGGSWMRPPKGVGRQKFSRGTVEGLTGGKHFPEGTVGCW